ncbi:MAG: DUF302 domain-containing protein [Pseudomonadota bacterium]
MRATRTHPVTMTLLLLFAAGTALASGHSDGANSIVRYTTAKAFSDVIFELNFAITERNFRITGRNTVGEGLRRRGYEDFPDVEVIHFCSLEVAREVLLIDPGFVAQMPCRITVHTNQSKTVISVIKLPIDHEDDRVNEFARRMNKTLEEIVGFVLETQ